MKILLQDQELFKPDKIFYLLDTLLSFQLPFPASGKKAINSDLHTVILNFVFWDPALLGTAVSQFLSLELLTRAHILVWIHLI